MATPKLNPREELAHHDQTGDPRDAVARARRGGRVVVTDEDDRPIAAVVPLADLDRLESDDRKRVKAIAGLERIGQYFADCDPDEVEREAIKAIAEIRAERRAAPKA